jgi:hypothetical protein
VAGALGEHRLVGSFDAGTAERHRIPQHAVCESLRRLRQIQGVARNRIHDNRFAVTPFVLDTLDRVAHGDGRDRGAVGRCRSDHAGDHLGGNEWTGRIVHKHDVRARIRGIETVCD